MLRKELADEIGQTAVGPQIQFLAQTKYEGTTDINVPKKGQAISLPPNIRFRLLGVFARLYGSSTGRTK